MKVGIIGLGIIGSRIAANYTKAGHDVVVWSRTRREMPNFAANLPELARHSEIIQLFVLDGAALLAAVQEMAPELRPGQIVVNSATVSLQATLDAASVVDATGAAFLDCPFTGSRDASAAGQLVYYVGGDSAVLEQATPLLAASSKEILPMGKIGDATVIKIATNMVSAVTVQVVSEAMAVTRSAGVPLEAFQRAMESNASGSGLVKMKVPTMRQGDYTPHFSLKNMLKDSRFALELAKKASLNLPALSATSQQMAGLAAADAAEQDYSALFRQFDP
jgi:3-hydroxyisobutyrate dehydrogenase-like beta-hydroxyacid dehydrogenase